MHSSNARSEQYEATSQGRCVCITLFTYLGRLAPLFLGFPCRTVLLVYLWTLVLDCLRKMRITFAGPYIFALLALV